MLEASGAEDPFKALALLNTLTTAANANSDKKQEDLTAPSPIETMAPSPSTAQDNSGMPGDDSNSTFVYVPPQLIPKSYLFLMELSAADVDIAARACPTANV